mmetsp:Transcript_134365/g.348025  ORF Transcript_134365/g.348025 Transcript_134365/m.348025 type:complete len:217 (+) Transcript_134365:362-1012(+)
MQGFAKNPTVHVHLPPCCLHPLHDVPLAEPDVKLLPRVVQKWRHDRLQEDQVDLLGHSGRHLADQNRCRSMRTSPRDVQEPCMEVLPPHFSALVFVPGGHVPALHCVLIGLQIYLQQLLQRRAPIRPRAREQRLIGEGHDHKDHVCKGADRPEVRYRKHHLLRIAWRTRTTSEEQPLVHPIDNETEYCSEQVEDRHNSGVHHDDENDPERLCQIPR